MENDKTDYLEMIKFLEKQREESDKELAEMTDKERIDYLSKQHKEAVKDAKEKGIKTLKISRGEND